MLMLLLAVRLQFTWILKLIFEFLGGWQGSAQFRLDFNHGGAIEFGQNVLKTASNPPVIAPVPTMVNPMTGDPFTMGGIYPPPPPSYSGVPPAGAGVYDPNTGFYTFPGASAPPPPQNDAPPSYDELQETFQNLSKVVLDLMWPRCRCFGLKINVVVCT